MHVPQIEQPARRPELFVLVVTELTSLGIDGLDASRIGEDSLLVDDLGLDSLKFVDLTLRLEEALGIDEFPMQDWVDAQLESQRPLSVRALVEVCSALLGAQRGVACA